MEMNMNYKNLIAKVLLACAVLGASCLAAAQDVRMYARHDVTDYALWKKSYDGASGLQKSHGVFYQSVWQSADNPNDVTVVHDFHSIEKAKSFANSKELKDTMMKSGVKGTPQIWYTYKGAK
jgi:hypothetical protein